jgi:primosomal protein N' (replication factor Y)
MQAPLFEDAARPDRRGIVVQIALPVPIDSLFSYTVPDEMAEHAQPGHRALVPFSGRRLTGLIVERDPDGSEATQHEQPQTGGRRLSRIDRILDREPVVSPAMIGLLREAAHDLLCPIGLALNHALPPGSSPRVAHQLELTERGRRALDDGAASDVVRAVLAALREAPLTPAALARQLSTGPKNPAPPVRELTRSGLIAKVDVEVGPRVREARIRLVVITPGVDVDETCSGVLARAPKQAELLRQLVGAGEVPTSDLTATNPSAPALLRALANRGLVEFREKVAPRNVLGPAIERDQELPLTSEQSGALAAIEAAMQSESATRFLLHGVTGSGKTEVYLRAIASALRAGRRALVLVPEITLTHQIVARLRARFGDELAILHSGLRPGERLEQWQRLRRGQVPIAVGARSALFAPIERLGVIVVDEEHDSAYKNEEGFRYHARDLAERRAQLAGCPLVLGTATPALETRYRAEQGGIERLVLARRIGGRPLPAVDIVNLAAERARAPRGRKLILAKPLRRAITETLAVGGQTILFLNRRGFSTQIYCFECGFAERCKDCDVALVYHSAENRLRCHYCDHNVAPPEVCGGCGAPDTALLGLGTERVEEEVRTLFPDARVGRLDRDTASQRGHTESILRALRDREIDLLIGTQMVAKGHDFPGVQLVGVIAADIGLHMPDFRAAERTFQVLTQVAGRAGRAGTPGRVVLQTFVPDHYAIRPVRDHDYETFYREELQHRADTGYPPFSRLCQVLVSGEDEAATRAAAERLGTAAASAARQAAALAQTDQTDQTNTAPPQKRASAAVQVLGPAPCPLARLRGRYRFQLLLKGSHNESLDRVVRHVARETTRLPKGLRAVVDVNPGSML